MDDFLLHFSVLQEISEIMYQSFLLSHITPLGIFGSSVLSFFTFDGFFVILIKNINYSIAVFEIL